MRTSDATPRLTGLARGACALLVVFAAWTATAVWAPQASAANPGFSSIPGNFNGTAIPAGKYIWFNSVLKLTGTVPTTTFTINFTGQSVTYGSPVNTTFTPPNSQVTYSATATTATTSYNAGTNTWQTTIPLSIADKNSFLGGFTYQVPSNLTSATTNPVNWSGTFTVTASPAVAVQLNWQYAAAVYNSFSTNLNSLNVKPTDDDSLSAYLNSDHAGTPEAYTIPGILPGGATGGGGSNWTGSYSGTAGVTPPSTTSPVLSTHVSATPIYSGQSFTDTATLSSTSTSATATGTITFNVYGPGDPLCAGSPVFPPSTVTVNGNGNYTSGSFTPVTTGTYRVIAVYSGDTFNTPITTGCMDMFESVLVQADTTPPTCILTATIPGPPKQIKVTAQDPQSGIVSIVVDSISNATATTDAFVPGTTAAIVTTGTKTNQSLGSFLRLKITNGAGQTTTCDPIVPARERTRPATPRGKAAVTGSVVILKADTSSVVYGDQRGVTLTGVLPGRRAGQKVAVLTRSCGFTGSAHLATITTRAGGLFSYRLQPAITTSFSISTGSTTSRALGVAVHPSVGLTRSGSGRYRVDVSTTNGYFLSGKRVDLQRLSGKRWVTVAHARLAKNSPIDAITAVSSATLRANGAGQQVRAVLARSQTGCYAAGTSAAIAG